MTTKQVDGVDAELFAASQYIKQLETERSGWKEAYQDCRDRLWELQQKVHDNKEPTEWICGVCFYHWNKG